MQPFERAPVLVVLAGAVAAIFWQRHRVMDCLRRFFTAEAHPTNLAVFRVVFFGAVLLRVWEADPVGGARAVGELPPALMEPPQVMGWVIPRLPLGDAAITVAGLALIGGAIAGLLGVAARAGALACAVAMTYLMAAPNYFWKVNHDHQHLVWFALILAAAPAADALSIRRARQMAMARRRGGPAPPLAEGRRYALPLRMTWLVLGSIYLFAGIGKLQVGWDWFTAENLRHFLWLHWAGSDWVPGIRVDQWDGVLAAAAVATVVVELGFLPAMFLPRARLVFAVLGTGFHLVVRWLLRISHFWTLQVAYVTFVDWHGLARRTRPGAGAPAVAGRTGPDRLAVLAPATALVAVAVFLAGALGLERGWPVARYPTFGYLPGDTTSELVFDVAYGDGRTEELRAARLVRAIGAARYQLLTLRAMAQSEEAERTRRLRAIWAVAAPAEGFGEIREVDVYQVRRWSDPDRRAGPPRRVRIAVFRPGAGLEETGG
ncbi:MAG: HTTM domain-containing protein [Acidimicrobiales bacterium]